MSGKVYLTGSGPGDEKLLTLKAAEVLADCDVLVYDFLASNIDIYKYSPQSEKIYVGKSGHHHNSEQEEINKLLIEKAKLGKKVVRLKGGDPFVFGRGGEEALALVEAGIDYEVIPGVSSFYSVPAYAGIPTTQRGYTSSLAIVTGHDKSSTEADLNWKSLAESFGTIVFLMGVKNLANISAKLLKYGKDPNTPVALIRWGTTERQEVIDGVLENITEKVREKDFRAPAIIVVGEVVSLRDKLKWFEKKPLFSKTIIVTRAGKQASELSNTLSSLGARVIEIPTIKINRLSDYSLIDKAISKQQDNSYYNWLIFTSANAVHYFNERLKEKKTDFRIFKDTKIAAVGPSTQKCLEEIGLYVDLVPKEHIAEGILSEIGDVDKTRILIPRAIIARETLVEELIENGAQVDVAPVYETTPDKDSTEKLMSLNHKVDAITFTSSSTASNFAAILDGKELDMIKDAKIVVIGPATAKTAKEKGFTDVTVAKDYTIDGLVKAIVDLFSK